MKRFPRTKNFEDILSEETDFEPPHLITSNSHNIPHNTANQTSESQHLQKLETANQSQNENLKSYQPSSHFQTLLHRVQTSPSPSFPNLVQYQSPSSELENQRPIRTSSFFMNEKGDEQQLPSLLSSYSTRPNLPPTFSPFVNNPRGLSNRNNVNINSHNEIPSFYSPFVNEPLHAMHSIYPPPSLPPLPSHYSLPSNPSNPSNAPNPSYSSYPAPTKLNARLHQHLDWDNSSNHVSSLKKPKIVQNNAPISSNYNNLPFHHNHNHHNHHNHHHDLSSNENLMLLSDSKESVNSFKRSNFIPKNTLTPPVDIFKKREIQNDPSLHWISSKEQDFFSLDPFIQQHQQLDPESSNSSNTEEKTFEDLFFSLKPDEFSLEETLPENIFNPLMEFQFSTPLQPTTAPLFTCPVCSETNFTEDKLVQHVLERHSRKSDKMRAVSFVFFSFFQQINQLMEFFFLSSHVQFVQQNPIMTQIMFLETSMRMSNIDMFQNLLKLNN